MLVIIVIINFSYDVFTMIISSYPITLFFLHPVHYVILNHTTPFNTISTFCIVVINVIIIVITSILYHLILSSNTLF